MKEKNFLKKYHQEHLLQFWATLSDVEKKNLKKQISELPLAKMQRIYINSYRDEIINGKKINPLKVYSDKDLALAELGETFIQNYALITLSGGSGSRFGYSKAKGTYPFLINGKETSMFQIEAEKLQEIFKKYEVYIPWYIMTSEKNNQEIKEFFEAKKYFGYPQEKIIFFKQKSLPILNIHGKLVLKSPSEILYASDGNGSIFQILKKSNILKQLQEKRIKYVQVINIDNILAKLFDPMFIGLMAKNNYLVGAKTLYKKDPNTNEYVFLKYKNHPFLCNVNTISSLENKKEYRDTFSGISIFHIDALKKLQNIPLRYHRAYKAYSFYEPNGNFIKSDEKNSFKFEKFIFDGFFHFKDMLIDRVNEDEFLPIKNQEDLQKGIKILEGKNK